MTSAECRGLVRAVQASVSTLLPSAPHTLCSFAERCPDSFHKGGPSLRRTSGNSSLLGGGGGLLPTFLVAAPGRQLRHLTLLTPATGLRISLWKLGRECTREQSRAASWPWLAQATWGSWCWCWVGPGAWGRGLEPGPPDRLLLSLIGNGLSEFGFILFVVNMKKCRENAYLRNAKTRENHMFQGCSAPPGDPECVVRLLALL